ncbi:hypothetical protein V6N13_051037 [Hibiscus sabdariffa]|uniref:Uncharacterized protein n=1 Tax=Hibiscus sabdariffa TaxID=183260 RepID=A0ABR2T2G2_9ROSI
MPPKWFGKDKVLHTNPNKSVHSVINTGVFSEEHLLFSEEAKFGDTVKPNLSSLITVRFSLLVQIRKIVNCWIGNISIGSCKVDNVCWVGLSNDIYSSRCPLVPKVQALPPYDSTTFEAWGIPNKLLSCHLCLMEDEYAKHLLCHYHVTWNIWLKMSMDV